LKAVGIDVDLLVGGAALSRRFTHRKIAAAYGGLCTYAKDAMTGLKLVESLTNPEARKGLRVEVEKLIAEDRAGEDAAGVETPLQQRAPSAVRRDLVPPRPPDLARHVVAPDLDEVWALVNPQMLYGKHLGLRGSVKKLQAEGDERYRKLARVLDEVKEEARSAFGLRVLWRFFPTRSVDERVTLYGDNGQGELGSWVFPRQAAGDRLCLADFVLPEDYLALFVTTAGDSPRQLSLRWKESGDYLKSHALASLALESAEAAAEWLHRKLRAEWGFPDPPEISDQEIFSARYHGRRYSFGYPACPDLAGQRLLFELLQPRDIGVTLTEGDMMDPEASVSAIVVHHPEARYFGV
jgi:5-methyltetrahydrofolate--homocysteine methyltransferase